MKPRTIVLGLLIASLAIPFSAHGQTRRRSSSSNVDGNRAVSDCGDIRVTFDRQPALMEEAQLTAPSAQVPTLSAATGNSGIYVTGWDRNEVSIKTCKAVPADDPDASSTLREITTTLSSGRVSVDGPGGKEWMAHLIIMVPRLSSMDLTAANGPLQVRDLAGNIHLSAANGPITLVNVGGSVEATTANGPISLSGGSGDQRLTATNGPIQIALSGNRWDGPGLQATTQNGPLNVGIPDNFGSGVRLQTSDRSPIKCESPLCSQAAPTIGSQRVIQIGSGDPVVRLSTMNGPLSIQSANN